MSGSIVWLRHDLRIADNPALLEASRAGWVLPVFVVDDEVALWGAAFRWRVAQALSALEAGLRARGSGLVVVYGAAEQVLADLARATGAGAVHVSHDAPDLGLPVLRHAPNALVPRGSVLTGQGTPYRVFTPFWKAMRQADIAAPAAAPDRLDPPPAWPESQGVARLARGMDRGAAVVAGATKPGEDAAMARLRAFLKRLPAYPTDRDRPDRDATSGLSDALATGEIGARQIWAAGQRAIYDGVAGADKFLSELAWREFGRELLHHWPDLPRQNFAQGWDDFPWRGDSADAEAWRRALTGVDLVDAGMRELYATGTMHNRVRMVVASYLTKHLLTDWRVGLDWFAQTLTDWDAASNAMNWQWVAGCGPDAAPFFRIFNPLTQQQKFDPQARYTRYWLEGEGDALFRAAIPRSWQIPTMRPEPLIALDQGRKRALAAYQKMRG
ncbi:MAG: deoxyribodipyrimidine photo-lyase [Paracoccus sp. (in: a-proteobacteria)]|nr:deoxyribodipyrimidine photo-lyase [Paracoccus sp. (in: a-proteobacteria)]